MDDLTLARVLHVVAVVPWIGGVAFVTTVLMPAIRRSNPPETRLAAFHRFESGFAWQARLWVALAGLSGFWMIDRANLWPRFADAHFWWMHAMVAVWLIFAAMLFVVEPLGLHRRMSTSPDPARSFLRMERMHRVLLAASVLALVGAVGGSHAAF